MSSQQIEDGSALQVLLKSYELPANAYLNKPVHLEVFERLVKSIHDFWLTRVKLPQQVGG